MGVHALPPHPEDDTPPALAHPLPVFGPSLSVRPNPELAGELHRLSSAGLASAAINAHRLSVQSNKDIEIAANQPLGVAPQHDKNYAEQLDISSDAEPPLETPP